MSQHHNHMTSHAPGLPHRQVVGFDAHDHSAYRPDHKLAEHTTCPQCHASIHEGRWQWLEADTGGAKVVCPACRRIHDRFPAGYVSVEGDFFSKHRVELMSLVENQVNRAAAEHPMSRLMKSEDTPGGVMLTTTDTHLARQIGGALHEAYGGRVHYSSASDQEFLRVEWRR